MKNACTFYFNLDSYLRPGPGELVFLDSLHYILGRPGGLAQFQVLFQGVEVKKYSSNERHFEKTSPSQSQL